MHAEWNVVCDCDISKLNWFSRIQPFDLIKKPPAVISLASIAAAASKVN